MDLSFLSCACFVCIRASLSRIFFTLMVKAATRLDVFEEFSRGELSMAES